MRTSWLAIVVISLAMLVGCDHATKFGAERELRDHGAIALVPGVELTYAQNHGVAFNLERHLPSAGRGVVVVGFGVAILGFLGGALWRRRGAMSAATAGYVLILGGALGNLLDRLARGYVVDFIHVDHWPVWNLADAFIVVGVGLLVLDARRERHST